MPLEMERKIATKRSTENKDRERWKRETQRANSEDAKKYHTCPRAEREPERHLGLEFPNLSQSLNASTENWVFQACGTRT